MKTCFGVFSLTFSTETQEIVHRHHRSFLWGFFSSLNFLFILWGFFTVGWPCSPSLLFPLIGKLDSSRNLPFPCRRLISGWKLTYLVQRFFRNVLSAMRFERESNREEGSEERGEKLVLIYLPRKTVCLLFANVRMFLSCLLFFYKRTCFLHSHLKGCVVSEEIFHIFPIRNDSFC